MFATRTICVIGAAVLLAVARAPACAQDLALQIPDLAARAGSGNVDSEPRVARVSEPIPLPPVASPKTDGLLTLGEAESMAAAYHPALREAEGRIRSAYGNWVQVGLRPNPEIGYAGNEIGDEGKAGQQGGFVSQEFVTGGKLDLNRAVAMRERAAAEQRLELTRLQVITTVRKYYFETLAAERAVTLTRQLSEIAAQSVVASQRRLEQQDVPKTSVLQSQIESESATMLEQQASERHAAARRRLATVLGSADQPPAMLEDVFARPLPELDYATLRDRIVADSPELAELRFAVDRARWQVQRASAGRVPNVSTMAGVQFDNATEDTIGMLQVSMPIPVFDRNQGAVTQACGELAAAQAALQARQLAIEQRLTLALRDYKTARERVKRYSEKILPTANETLTLINMGYQHGELNYQQLLMVQQTYASKNLSYLQDLETAWQLWAEIDGFLAGDLSPNSIDRPAQTPENREERKY